MKTKHRVWSYVILGLVLAFVLVLTFMFPGLKQFASPEFIRTFILGFGAFSFLIYVVLVTLAVPLPIPSTPVIIAGGYVFGDIAGFLIALISMILGSILSFYLIRWTGKPLLESLVDRHHIDHFDRVFKKRGPTAAIISYAIPIFPSDMISLFLGLTQIKTKTFLFAVVIGHIPRVLIINALGSDLYSGFTLTTLFTFLFATAFIFIAVFRERVKKYLFRELRELEKEVKAHLKKKKE